MKKKKSSKAKASYKMSRNHTDNPKAEKLESRTNNNGGPENRADSELKHMMNHKPTGMRQTSRRTK
jgi:hypothetical protein